MSAALAKNNFPFTDDQSKVVYDKYVAGWMEAAKDTRVLEYLRGLSRNQVTAWNMRTKVLKTTL